MLIDTTVLMASAKTVCGLTEHLVDGAARKYPVPRNQMAARKAIADARRYGRAFLEAQNAASHLAKLVSQVLVACKRNGLETAGGWQTVLNNGNLVNITRDGRHIIKTIKRSKVRVAKFEYDESTNPITEFGASWTELCRLAGMDVPEPVNDDTEESIEVLPNETPVSDDIKPKVRKRSKAK
jgi:hypothetical protein